jgi:tetratricopeptide (TPR) repeat protein
MDDVLPEGGEQLDPITSRLREEEARQRRLTLRFTLIPVAVGLAVVAGSYWGIRAAQDELRRVENGLTEARHAKAEVDQEITRLEEQRAGLEKEVADHHALFDSYESRLPAEAKLINHGLEVANQGNYPAAIRDYREALERDPQNVQALTFQGFAYYKSGQHTQAIESLRRAIELAPSSAEAHYDLGYALWAAGDKDGAAREIEKAFAIDRTYEGKAHGDPAYKPIWEHRDQMAAARSSAAPAEQQVIQEGLAAAKRGALADAITSYGKALEFNPQNTQVLNWQGYAYFRGRQFDQAIEIFKRALDVDPSLAEVHYNLGLALWKVDKKEEAAREVAEAFRIDPGYEVRANRDRNYLPIRAFRANRNPE